MATSTQITSHSKRISWIDICRGIGIVLVLYGHVLGSDESRYLIYSFHMPLFFFLSGMVFSHKKITFRTLVVKNIKQILIPYFFIALVTYLIWVTLIHPSTFQDILSQLFGILYGNGNFYDYLQFNAPLWFLPCLFVTKLLFAFITKFISKRTSLAIILIIFSIIGYASSQYFPALRLPFGAEISLTAIAFFGLGYLWKNQQRLTTFLINHSKYFLPLSIILTGVFAYSNFILSGHQIDMRINHINNYLLFYLGACSGICMVISISLLVKKNSFIEYLGKHTLQLFAWHYIIYTFFTVFTNPIHILQTASMKIFFPTIYTVLAISIILISNKILKTIKPSIIRRVYQSTSS